MRDRGLNPFPFRCDSGRAFKSDEYPLDLSLADAVALWARTRSLFVSITLNYPSDGLLIKGDFYATRVSAPDEWSLRDSSLYQSAYFTGSFDQSVNPQIRTLSLTLYMFGAPAFYPESPRAYWTGVHAVPKRSRLVTGTVQPRLVVSVSGFWDVGGEYVIEAANRPISGEDSPDGNLTARIFGAPVVMAGFAADPTLSSLVVDTATAYPYARANGTEPVFTDSGQQLLDPTLARIETTFPPL